MYAESAIMNRLQALLLFAVCLLSLCTAIDNGLDGDDDVQIDPLQTLVLNPGKNPSRDCLIIMMQGVFVMFVSCSHSQYHPRFDGWCCRGTSRDNCIPSDNSVPTVPQSKKRI